MDDQSDTHKLKRVLNNKTSHKTVKQIYHDHGYLVTQDKLNRALGQRNEQFGDRPRHMEGASISGRHRTSRVSCSQLEVLCEFLKSHRNIAFGYNKSIHDREYSRRMWQRITHSLNSMREGSIKSWREWASYWIHYKKKLKRQGANINSVDRKIGSGPLSKRTQIEEKLINIIMEEELSGVHVDRFMKEPEPSKSSVDSHILLIVAGDGENPVQTIQNNVNTIVERGHNDDSIQAAQDRDSISTERDHDEHPLQTAEDSDNISSDIDHDNNPSHNDSIHSEKDQDDSPLQAAQDSDSIWSTIVVSDDDTDNSGNSEAMEVETRESKPEAVGSSAKITAVGHFRRELHRRRRELQNGVNFNNWNSNIEDDHSTSRRVSYNQLMVLCKFLSSHRSLAFSHNKSAQDRDYSTRMWQRVTRTLNSTGEGAIKNWQAWSKYWIDYKGKLRRKAGSIHYGRIQIRDGSSELPLSEVERRFLNIMGEDLGSDLPDHRMDSLNNPELSTSLLDTDIPIVGGHKENLLQAQKDSGSISCESDNDTDNSGSSSMWIKTEAQTRRRKLPINKKEGRRRQISYKQLEGLCEFLNSHRNLASGYNKSAYSRDYTRRLWQKAARTLDSESDGARKYWKGWSMYWKDYKAKLKRKAASIRNGIRRTGDWSSSEPPFTELEKRFLNIIEDLGSDSPGVHVDPSKNGAQDSIRKSTSDAGDDDDAHHVGCSSGSDVGSGVDQPTGSLATESETDCFDSGRTPAQRKKKPGRRRHRVTYSQLKVLYKFLNSHRNIVCRPNKTPKEREHSRRLWQRVTHTLNSMGEGAIKKWAGWSKYWNDYKATLKRKAAGIPNSRRRQAADGPSSKPILSEIERRFLNLMGDLGSGLPHVDVDPFMNRAQRDESAEATMMSQD